MLSARRSRRFQPLVLLIVLNGVACAQVQSPVKSPSKAEQAEAAADRIFKRFYETLNFGDIYREQYVGRDLRKAEVDIIAGNMMLSGPGDPSTTKATIAFPARERAYIANSNYRWLSAAASMTYDGDRELLQKEMGNAFELYYSPLNDKATWPILTSEQLDTRLTSRMNSLADFFRKYVVPKNVDTEAYRLKCKSISETKPPEDLVELKQLFAYAGLSSDAEIFVVRRERFYIYLLEENGAFKMLSFSDRIRF